MKPSALTALIVGGLFGMLLSFASCGSKAPCSAVNCAGCCDSTGMCVSGATTTSCGAGGNLCKACSSGQSCSSGLCKAGNGGTGGGTGGGTASNGGGTASNGGGTASNGGGTESNGGGTAATGGGTGGCSSSMTIASIPSNSIAPDQGGFREDMQNPGFAEEDAFVLAPGSTQTSFNILWPSWYYADGMFPAKPYMATIGTKSFFQCSDCIVYSSGCDQMLNCTEDYLAQAGTLTVTASSEKADAGTFAGTVANLHMVQWNLMMDTPIAGGKCVDITAGSFQATWPRDAG
jgi:hypothetical protein